MTSSGSRLLVISGSSRRGSLNRQLAAAAATLARERGAQVTELDLRDLDLPIYDGDLEASLGVPPGAAVLRDALHGCDALLLVSPEYNGFPPPLLINAFDWLSRLRADQGQPAGLAVTAGKPVALMAASPGALGGLRAMNFLRQYLQMAFAMLVLPPQQALSRANEAFDEAGRLRDAKVAASVDQELGELLTLATRLAPAAT